MEERWGSRSTSHTVTAAPTVWVPKKPSSCPPRIHMPTFPWFLGNLLSRLHLFLWAPPTSLMSPPHLSWPSPLLVSQATPLTCHHITIVPLLCYSPCLSSRIPKPPSSDPFPSFQGLYNCPSQVGALGVHAEFMPATAGSRLRSFMGMGRPVGQEPGLGVGN